MAELLDAIRKACGLTRYRAVIPPLDPHIVMGKPGAFRFGLPWPWESAAAEAGLMDAAGQDLSVTPLAQAVFPRTDATYVGVLVWSEQKQSDIDASFSRLGLAFAQLYRASHLKSRRVLLDGSHAALVELASPFESIWRLVCAWPGGELQGEFRCPATQVGAYAAHFDTALGTWVWG